jgi:hypothetical protein
MAIPSPRQTANLLELTSVASKFSTLSLLQPLISSADDNTRAKLEYATHRYVEQMANLLSVQDWSDIISPTTLANFETYSEEFASATMYGGPYDSSSYHPISGEPGAKLLGTVGILCRELGAYTNRLLATAEREENEMSLS